MELKHSRDCTRWTGSQTSLHLTKQGQWIKCNTFLEKQKGRVSARFRMFQLMLFCFLSNRWHRINKAVSKAVYRVIFHPKEVTPSPASGHFIWLFCRQNKQQLANSTSVATNSFDSLTFSLPESIMKTCYVVLTFESVDEILWCDHSNETSSAVLLHGTICFSIFCKMKFGIFLGFWFLAFSVVKGLN